jgi:hypothetical protein
MTIPEVLYAIALCLIGGVISFLVCTTRRDIVSVVIFFQISYWFRAVFVAINNIMNFFLQKYASDFSIGLMDQPGGIWSLFTGTNILSTANVTSMKFFLEALINLPAVRFFENSTVMLNYTNAFVGSVAGLVAFAYMRRIFNERIGTYALLLASVYPAALNFSFFAIRDIIIYLFLMMNIFSFVWLMLRRDHRVLNIAIYGVSFICATVLRVTFIIFILILPGWFLLMWIMRNVGKVRHLYERMFLSVVAALILMISASVVTLGAYFVVLHQVGITTLVGPEVLLQDYASARAGRGSGISQTMSAADAQGTFSMYVPLSTFTHMPFMERVALQLAAFIIIPLPWQLTAASRALAVTDSVFVICCMWWSWRLQMMLRGAARDGPRLPPILAQYELATLRRLGFALMIAFVASWFGFGVLVSDSGNAFRMRLSVEPFILFASSIYAAQAMRWIEVGLKRAIAAPSAARLAPGE